MSYESKANQSSIDYNYLHPLNHQEKASSSPVTTGKYNAQKLYSGN